MNAQLAFVGATGDSLHAPSATQRFVVGAVVVDAAHVAAVRSGAESALRLQLQTGEVSTLSVGHDAERPLRALRALAALDFTFYGFVVDKAELAPTGGLIYKQPFLKFLQGKVYERLFAAFPDIHVVADEGGAPEFMAGLAALVRKRHNPTLFDRERFRFEASRNDALVQLAGFIAGGLVAALEPSRASITTADLLEAIGSHRALIEEWPIRQRPFGEMDPEPAGPAEDAAVRALPKSSVPISRGAPRKLRSRHPQSSPNAAVPPREPRAISKRRLRRDRSAHRPPGRGRLRAAHTEEVSLGGHCAAARRRRRPRQRRSRLQAASLGRRRSELRRTRSHGRRADAAKAAQGA